MNRLSVLVVVLVFGNGHAMATTDVLVTAPAGGSPNEAWPRTMSLGTVAAVVYQPQVKAWSGDKLDFRGVVVANDPPQVITTEMSARHACSSSRSGCRPASSRVAACALAL